MAMETSSSNTVSVKEEGRSAECKSFISISSGGSSPVGPAVPTHQQAKCRRQ
jgi:hypothetical protein